MPGRSLQIQIGDLPNNFRVQALLNPETCFCMALALGEGCSTQAVTRETFWGTSPGFQNEIRRISHAYC